MRNAIVIIVALGGSLAGCKKDEKGAPAPGAGTAVPAPPKVAPDAAAAPAPPPDAAAFDEMAFRKGKKTGLGAADEKPEVATEELIVAIAEGKVDPAQFLDPALGFLESKSLPGGGEKAVPDVDKRHCGANAAKQATSYAKTYVAERDRWQKLDPATPPEDAAHAIDCSNGFLAAPDPTFGAKLDDQGNPQGGTSLAYALCSSAGAGEYDAAYDLVFVPDAERGLRLVGVMVWEVGVAEVPWARFFAPEALKTGPQCP
jgi:hypothetical protein